MKHEKIISFEQLIAWRRSQDLAVEVYKLTRSFPKDEQFALTNQIRRASTSISANIAEGFGRKTLKDKLHFYAVAYGSLLEVKNFIYLAERLEYLHGSKELLALVTDCQKLINALSKSLNNNA